MQWNDHRILTEPFDVNAQNVTFARVIDNTLAWDRNLERSGHVYEWFHENSKVRSFDARASLKRVANQLTIIECMSLVETKGFEGLPFIDPMDDHDTPRNAPTGSAIVNGNDETDWSKRMGRCLHRSLRVHSRDFTERDIDNRAQCLRSVDGFTTIDAYVINLEYAGWPRGIYYFHPLNGYLYRFADADSIGKFGDAVLFQLGPQAFVACVVLVGVFPRAVFAWGERGYRHTLFEAGMKLEGLRSAAWEAELEVRIVPGFVDDVVNLILGLDGVQEASLCCLAIR